MDVSPQKSKLCETFSLLVVPQVSHLLVAANTNKWPWVCDIRLQDITMTTRCVYIVDVLEICKTGSDRSLLIPVTASSTTQTTLHYYNFDFGIITEP